MAPEKEDERTESLPGVDRAATSHPDTLRMSGSAFARKDVSLGSRAGRYDILEQIGEGGMGQVFLAYDPTLQRTVALKLLRGAGAEQVERFQNEARAQARVDHENVCRVYEVGVLGDTPFIAMQYIAGSTLDQAAREMTLEQKVMVMMKVASAIQAAHRLGLIHRDLKPA
ncbi:MAG: serine/threonine-protein kinase, partial [Thermoanaerobaculia bacterium]